MEEWRPCIGFENYYEVSNEGRVRSVRRVLSFTDNKPPRTSPVRILKCQIDEYGYVRVRFCVNQIRTSHRIHRLVSLAFIDNPEGLPQVNHKDGNKRNNLVDNLEWCTNSENQIHAIANGLKIHHFGERAKRFTGSVEAYDCTGKLVAVMSGNEDMAKHGFDFRLVSAVLKNKRKSHRGCTFKKLEKE